jgi:hypothetical protein
MLPIPQPAVYSCTNAGRRCISSRAPDPERTSSILSLQVLDDLVMDPAGIRTIVPIGRLIHSVELTRVHVGARISVLAHCDIPRPLLPRIPRMIIAYYDDRLLLCNYAEELPDSELMANSHVNPHHSSRRVSGFARMPTRWTSGQSMTR